jgi:organic radical activating enzyme
VASTLDRSTTAVDRSGSGFLSDRIVHLHPTRLCNLACAHCYSQSGPDAHAALDPGRLIAALELLRAEAYAVVSLSGGEPLVYRDLRFVVREAKALGYRVTMISNGLLVNARTFAVIADLDAIAISFDGLAATHDKIRGRSGAFDRASGALERLANDGVPVAAAVSVTRDMIPELPDLAFHLAERGARAVQIRPVARSGRARSMSQDVFARDEDRARLFLVAAALAEELAPEVRVHCDLAPSQGLWRQRNAYAALLAQDGPQATSRPLADLVNPLVVTDSGQMKPIAYDFATRFDLASLDRFTLDEVDRYKSGRLAAFRAMMSDTLAGLERSNDLVDWFDLCTRRSESWPTPG